MTSKGLRSIGAKQRSGAGRITAWLLTTAAAGVPLATSATCDTSNFSLSLFRDRGYYDSGYVDVFVDDGFYVDDCYWFDCW